MTPGPKHDDYGSISIAGKPLPPELPPQKPAPQKNTNVPRPPAENAAPPGRLGWLKWLTASLATLAALFFLGSYVGIPWLATKYLPTHLEKILKRPVTIAKAEFDPFSLQLTLHNGIVGPRLDKEKDEVDPLLSFTRFMIDLEAGGLLRGRLVCRNSEIDRFFLHVVRESEDSYNITSLLGEDDRLFFTPPQYSLNNIKVNAGTVVFTDRPTGKTHNIEQINLAIPALSNIAFKTEQYIQPKFSATINGSPIELSGETTLRGESLEAKLSLQLKDLDLPAHIQYLPAALPFKVTQGKITLDCGLIFANHPDTPTKFQLEGSGKLTGLWLQDPEGNVSKFDSVDVIGKVAPLVHEFIFQEITLSQPNLHLDKNPKGKWNVPALFGEQSNANAPDSQKQPLLVIDSVKVINGKLTIQDRFVPRGFSRSWSGLQFSLKSFSSQGETPAEFALTAQGQPQSRISAQGKIFPARGLVDGLLVLDEADLAPLTPYISRQFEKIVIKSGQATKLQTQFLFESAKEKMAVRLKNLNMALKNLVLEREGQTLCAFPAIACEEAEIDFAGRGINMGKIRGDRAALSLWATGDSFSLGGSPAPSDKGGKVKEPWNVDLKEAQFKESAIAIKALVAAAPLLINLDNLELALTMSGAGKEGKKEGTIAGKAQLNNSGALEFSGPLQLDPFDARLTITLEDQGLAGFKPLFASWLNLDIGKGLASGSGALTLPKFSFSGNLTLASFAAAMGGKEIVAWEQATAENFELHTGPVQVKVPLIELKAPFLAWSSAKSGTPLAKVFKNPGPSTALPNVEIHEIQLSEGSMRLDAETSGAPFRAQLSGLNGRITNLSSQAGNLSQLDLHGMVEGEARLDCSGSLGFFDSHLFADLKYELTGMHVAVLAPYLDEILGFRSEQGKLAAAGTFHLEKQAFTTTPLFTLKDFKLGPTMGGNSHLPLTLALLTDKGSRLAVTIPVQGSYADQNFSIQQSIAKFVRGLMVKAAVAPFSLLPGAQAEPPPLQNMFIFEPGQEKLNAAQLNSLKAMSAMLTDRPGLKLVINAFADSKKDQQALFDLFSRQEAERVRQEEARIEEARIAAQISTQYGKEELAKAGGNVPPKAAAPPPPPPPPPQPRKIEVQKQDLLDLAQKRRDNIYAYFLEELGQPEKRLEKGEIRILTAEDIPGVRQGRVDFSLKSLK